MIFLLPSCWYTCADDDVGERFKSLRFLLTNSNVPERDGKKMIANVGQLKLDVCLFLAFAVRSSELRGL